MSQFYVFDASCNFLGSIGSHLGGKQMTETQALERAKRTGCPEAVRVVLVNGRTPEEAEDYLREELSDDK